MRRELGGGGRSQVCGYDVNTTHGAVAAGLKVNGDALVAKNVVARSCKRRCRWRKAYGAARRKRACRHLQGCLRQRRHLVGRSASRGKWGRKELRAPTSPRDEILEWL